MDASSAPVEVDGYGAAVVAPNGARYVFRTGKDGYSRIATSTSAFAEGSDLMLGQSSFGSIPAFLPTLGYTAPMPLSITGGRTFVVDIVVKIDGEIMDITDCAFSAQIRPDRDSTNLLADFDYEILDAENGSVRFSLTPDETYWLASNMHTGVWDVEIVTADGEVLTVIPESTVSARQGISRYAEEMLFDYGKDRVKPLKKNYMYFIGDTWIRDLVFKGANGVALDKTGCTYTMHLRRSKSDLTPAMTASFDLTQAASGVIVGTLDTSSAELGRYFFDIEEVDENDNVSTIVYGTFKFVQDVTRA